MSNTPTSRKKMKEYNVLECGCKYGVDNNEEVIYCKDHKKWDVNIKN